VRDCGKTTVLTLIELLVPEGNRTDSVSAAAIYHQLERRPRTVLLVDLLRSHARCALFLTRHADGGARVLASSPNTSTIKSAIFCSIDHHASLKHIGRCVSKANAPHSECHDTRSNRSDRHVLALR
jgi:hypothetical protein